MPDNNWSKHPFPPNQHLHFSPLRRIQRHKDSDGVLHNVLVQTEEMSCGLAAAAMLIDIWRHRRKPGGPDAEMRLKQIAGRLPGLSVVAEDNRVHSQGPRSGHRGSHVSNIETLLSHERVPITAVWYGWVEKPGTAALALGRIHHRPALLLWAWYNGAGTKIRGHFTVAARVTKAGDAVILDPWDGSMAELARAARYQGSGMLEAAVYTG
jgi:hypothetical protein